MEDNFEIVSLDIIWDNSLQALDFHFSLLGYLKEEALLFINVIDNPNLIFKLVDNSQPITDSKYKKVKK